MYNKPKKLFTWNFSTSEFLMFQPIKGIYIRIYQYPPYIKGTGDPIFYPVDWGGEGMRVV